jgi:hypothetical protein
MGFLVQFVSKDYCVVNIGHDYNSVIDHNLLFCTQRYNCLIPDTLYGNVNIIVHNHSNSFVGVNHVQIATISWLLNTSIDIPNQTQAKLYTVIDRIIHSFIFVYSITDELLLYDGTICIYKPIL